MAKISGILTDGAGQIINDCAIELYAKKTTSNVLTQTQAFQVANNGSYTMNVLPCEYDVNLIINGFPKKRLGSINVYSNSADGSLNDYLINPEESDLTPEFLKQVFDARDAAKKSATQAENSATAAKTSEINAQSSADTAKLNATNASVSASSASKSAATATEASTKANTAATSSKACADNASKSETTANQSAIQATNSATAAKTSEINANNAAKNAKTSEDNAKKWVSTIDTSTLVKKTGDTMSGQLILSKNGLKISYDNKNIMALVTSDDNYSHVFYDAEKKQWLSKLIYNSTTNSWSFQYINDVVINGKSVLKTGDYGIGSLTGAQLDNPDETLLGGCYATRTTSFPELTEYKNRNDSASLIVYPAWTPKWYVEKLAVVQSKTPRIYYRCATPEGKQSWYEALTTANASADVVGALPAIKSVVNGAPTYSVGDNIQFKKTPTVNGKSVITDLTSIDNKIELITAKLSTVGDFRLMPFRANKLPFGWYFRNGDNYLLSSRQGKALNGLSDNYKRDHQITIKNINGQQYINVPSAFASDGRGFFERAVNGTTRQVGSVQDDAIRNITGNFDNVLTSISDSTTGAFYRRSTHNKYNISKIGDGNGGELVSGDNFDASRVVPTANENRPLNMGMTPVIYLGV